MLKKKGDEILFFTLMLRLLRWGFEAAHFFKLTIEPSRYNWINTAA